MDKWQSIDQKPDAPCNALLNCPAFEWTDQHGNPVETDPMRDELECFELGFWDGDEWCEQGTGHAIFDGMRPDHLLPTHWMRLPSAPATTGATDER